MAITTQASVSARQQVADGIAPSVATVFGEQRTPQLAESFDLWYFDGLVLEPNVDFYSRVSPAHRVHYQILVDGKPAGYAISKDGEGPDPWRVTTVSPSVLARHIDEAITLLDEQRPHDTPVRLLKCGAYLVTAFWLFHDDHALDELLIASAPAYFRHVRRGAFVNPRDFVELLRQEEASLPPARQR